MMNSTFKPTCADDGSVTNMYMYICMYVCTYRIFRPIRRTAIFSSEILEKKIMNVF